MKKLFFLSFMLSAFSFSVPFVHAQTKEIIWDKDSSAMVLVPGGEFIMGSNEYENERPPHYVYLDSYYIDKYEVTNEHFIKFMNEWADSRLSGRGKDKDENGQTMIYENDWGVKKVGSRWQIGTKGYEKYPVVCVTWYGANQYAKWAGKRLPTEAEWEKACGAGSVALYCFGDESTKLYKYAWFDKNSGGKTHEVGTRQPNIWGIYDMHGNVLEWCSDWYEGNYYEGSPYKNPKGPDTGSFRVVRGGSWYVAGMFLRSVDRSWLDPVYWNYHFGFRCVVSAGAN